MLTEDKRALSALRMEHARECLTGAEALLKVKDYRGAANRSYYAVFHAMRAVLALDGVDMKHHSGIISEFRRRYIKTELLDKGLSEVIQLQSEYRTSSDYDDFFVLSKEEVTEQVSSAGQFLSELEAFLNKKTKP